jgi:H+/Cl- antiporter ClcA
MMAAGCSAGVSAAFGAPIGGALFAFEISKPNTFWKFSVIWKVFASCAISVFTLAIISGLMKGTGIDDLSSAVLKFGTIDITPPTIEVIPSSIIVGALCGVLGGIFVIVNSNLGLLRKKLITENWMKITEATLFSIMTTSTFYWLPHLFPQCKTEVGLTAESSDIVVQYTCVKGEYNPLATMFFNTEGDAIRSIISGFEGPGGIFSTDWHLVIFALAWYFWTIVTYGVWVPAGLFLPGIIIGCAVGGCYAELQAVIFDHEVTETYDSNTLVTPVLVGAGAMLSSYCRLTYSLVVIMLETTSSINIFLPMMIGILTARAVGNLFTGSLYDRALRMKQMPFLRSSAPKQTKYL